jgi:hypothetical protein
LLYTYECDLGRWEDAEVNNDPLAARKALKMGANIQTTFLIIKIQF